MQKSKFKLIISNYMNKLVGEWFGDTPLFNALAKTIVQVNVNKFDGLLDMLSDEKGDIDIDLLVDNFSEFLSQDVTIDLTSISPLLPRRILIFSKQDMQDLINKIREGN